MNYEGTEFTATAATRAAIVALMVLVAEIGSPSLAAADQVVFPAGTACEFELRVDIGESGQVTKEFRDKNDNLVGLLSAGRGATLVFTNDDTGATLSLKANGSVTRTTFNPDGSSTLRLMGHNVLILFPTDEPAGPSTTLVVGRAVIAVDANENFTVQQISGATTDICAALAG